MIQKYRNGKRTKHTLRGQRVDIVEDNFLITRTHLNDRLIKDKEGIMQQRCGRLVHITFDYDGEYYSNKKAKIITEDEAIKLMIINNKLDLLKEKHFKKLRDYYIKNKETSDKETKLCQNN